MVHATTPCAPPTTSVPTDCPAGRVALTGVVRWSNVSIVAVYGSCREVQVKNNPSDGDPYGRHPAN